MIFDKLLQFAHIGFGTMVLILGLVILIMQPKGNSWHKKLGMFYYVCMIGIAVSSILTMVFFRFSFFLFPVAIFSFHLVYSGIRAIGLKNESKVRVTDWIVAYTTSFIGIGLLGFAIYALIKGNTSLAILSSIFGFFITWSGYEDVKIYKNLDKQTKMWWWFHHMRGMGGSYIAAVTAFLVQNGNIIPYVGNTWMIWVLPGVIGGVGLTYWSKYYAKKFKSSNLL